MWKNIFTASSIVAIGVGLAVMVSTLSSALWFSPSDEIDITPPQHISSATTTTSSTTNTANALALGSVRPEEWPVQFSIPALAIQTNVQAVGISAKGNMAVPTNYTDVAWYRLGAAPGHLGSAVFDGHVDNGFGLAGVFKHLSSIKIGDIIETKSTVGTSTYAVEDIQLYPYDAVPLQTIFNRDDEARLVIITCDGAWIGDKKTYDHRLVVYAKLLSNS